MSSRCRGLCEDSALLSISKGEDASTQIVNVFIGPLHPIKRAVQRVRITARIIRAPCLQVITSVLRLCDVGSGWLQRQHVVVSYEPKVTC
jgi:hypothetical protein